MTYMSRTEQEKAMLANGIIIIRLRDGKVKRSPKIVVLGDFEQKGAEVLISCLLPQERGRLHLEKTWKRGMSNRF